MAIFGDPIDPNNPKEHKHYKEGKGISKPIGRAEQPEDPYAVFAVEKEKLLEIYRKEGLIKALESYDVGVDPWQLEKLKKDNLKAYEKYEKEAVKYLSSAAIPQNFEKVSKSAGSPNNYLFASKIMKQSFPQLGSSSGKALDATPSSSSEDYAKKLNDLIENGLNTSALEGMSARELLQMQEWIKSLEADALAAVDNTEFKNPHAKGVMNKERATEFLGKKKVFYRDIKTALNFHPDAEIEKAERGLSSQASATTQNSPQRTTRNTAQSSTPEAGPVRYQKALDYFLEAGNTPTTLEKMEVRRLRQMGNGFAQIARDSQLIIAGQNPKDPNMATVVDQDRAKQVVDQLSTIRTNLLDASSKKLDQLLGEYAGLNNPEEKRAALEQMSILQQEINEIKAVTLPGENKQAALDQGNFRDFLRAGGSKEELAETAKLEEAIGKLPLAYEFAAAKNEASTTEVVGKVKDNILASTREIIKAKQDVLEKATTSRERETFLKEVVKYSALERMVKKAKQPESASQDATLAANRTAPAADPTAIKQSKDELKQLARDGQISKIKTMNLEQLNTLAERVQQAHAITNVTQNDPLMEAANKVEQNLKEVIQDNKENNPGDKNALDKILNTLNTAAPRRVHVPTTPAAENPAQTPPESTTSTTPEAPAQPAEKETQPAFTNDDLKKFISENKNRNTLVNSDVRAPNRTSNEQTLRDLLQDSKQSKLKNLDATQLESLAERFEKTKSFTDIPESLSAASDKAKENLEKTIREKITSATPEDKALLGDALNRLKATTQATPLQNVNVEQQNKETPANMPDAKQETRDPAASNRPKEGSLQLSLDATKEHLMQLDVTGLSVMNSFISQQSALTLSQEDAAKLQTLKENFHTAVTEKLKSRYLLDEEKESLNTLFVESKNDLENQKRESAADTPSVPNATEDNNKENENADKPVLEETTETDRGGRLKTAPPEQDIEIILAANSEAPIRPDFPLEFEEKNFFALAENDGLKTLESMRTQELQDIYQFIDKNYSTFDKSAHASLNKITENIQNTAEKRLHGSRQMSQREEDMLIGLLPMNFDEKDFKDVGGETSFVDKPIVPFSQITKEMAEKLKSTGTNLEEIAEAGKKMSEEGAKTDGKNYDIDNIRKSFGGNNKEKGGVGSRTA